MISGPFSADAESSPGWIYPPRNAPTGFFVGRVGAASFMKGETEKLRAGTKAGLAATERKLGSILLHAFMVINKAMVWSGDQHRA